uniref:Uncharacterized protein n=1 Tax=viral metagenome TaxID=1070528 RepID=A0A6C0DP62_9ZZZZ
MEEIFEPNDQFSFEKLELVKPVSVAGGNFFIRFIANNSPLYIQPPKCITKQGIIRGTKRMYSDLMFTNENPSFIRWMENLETHCQQIIYNNRNSWFEGDLEMHDIENYFTSPMKVFKSGKFYIVRSNISLVLGKSTLKIYDEEENEVQPETITDETPVMTILEFQGIKCSARSFQIEIEVKQMMVLKPRKLFEKCIIKTPIINVNKQAYHNQLDIIPSTIVDDTIENEYNATTSDKSDDILENNIEPNDDVSQQNFIPDVPTNYVVPTISDTTNVETNNDNLGDEPENIREHSPYENTIEQPRLSSDLQEVDFNLEEISNDDLIQIKKRNDVYYEMYKEARRKAKIARDLALSAFLEAKNIKNTYMLDDVSESSNDSDFETIDNE